jgi:two-component system chemotaxis response regulator CheB
MGSPLKVLVVDDSAVSRRLLASVLAGDPELQVVGEARDGREAVRMAERLRPDVITMDIHMPDMDGFETTRRIMESSPRPIVIVSADYDPRDVARSFRALEAGALTVLPKPHNAGSGTFSDRTAELIETVKLMAGVNVFRRRARPGSNGRALFPTSSNAVPPSEIVAIGASTGGPAALATLLEGLPRDLGVPVLITQHLARGFDTGLAEWLDTVTDLDVRLAMAGEPLHPGTVLIAPSGSHLGVTSAGRAALSFSEALDGHRPSVSYLFSSVARAYGASALGVILTGMGEDGVSGLIELKGAGGRVLGQDQASCVVYGMPRAALRAGVVDLELPPATLAAAVAAYCRGAPRR